MADLPEARTIIQIEEARYRGALSEALFQKMAAVSNFISKRQYDSKQWDLCGYYGAFGAQVGVDTVFVALFDMEIIGLAMYNKVAGTAGTTTIDLRRFTASNTPSGGASIFTTKPAISYSAGANAFLCRRLLDSTNLESPAGTTMPVFATTQLNAGDMLTLNIDTVQTGGAQDCGLLLMMRPR